MQKDDAYLLDMLNAARKIRAFSADLSRESFDHSELHQYALVRLIEIIGEAARRVSEEGKQSYPQIAWKQISGMRNRIVHDYTRIDLELVWQTIQFDIPSLIVQLEPLVPPDQPDDQPQ